MMEQRRAIDDLIAAVRALPNSVDVWAKVQLSDRTARLYRRVYDKRPPGSKRTARLRKKRLRGMPTRDHLIWLLDRQRGARALKGMPDADRLALARQVHREKIEHEKGVWAGRITAMRGRIAALKAQAAKGGQALVVTSQASHRGEATVRPEELATSFERDELLEEAFSAQKWTAAPNCPGCGRPQSKVLTNDPSPAGLSQVKCMWCGTAIFPEPIEATAKAANEEGEAP